MKRWNTARRYTDVDPSNYLDPVVGGVPAADNASTDQCIVTSESDSTHAVVFVEGTSDPVSSAIVFLWVLDQEEGANPAWVMLEALNVTTQARAVFKVPPLAKLYMQISSVSNGPTAVRIGFASWPLSVV